MNGLCLFFLLNMVLFAGEKEGSLKLQIENISTPKGLIRVAIYDNDAHFLNEAYSIYSKVIRADKESTHIIEVPGLKYGNYAVAIYHDINANNKLDKNVLGVPIEPFGFSNNPKVKWREPSFSKVLFRFTPSDQTIQLNLQRWKL